MHITIEFTILKNPHLYVLVILIRCHFLAIFNIYSCNINFESACFAEGLVVVEK